MSINSAINQRAASNPAAALAASNQNVKAALLYGTQSGDTEASGALGALDSQATTTATLLDSVSHPFLGHNIDINA